MNVSGTPEGRFCRRVARNTRGGRPIKMNMQKRLIGLLVCLFVPVGWAQESEKAPVLSPDKKWAYRVVDAEPVIVRARSGEVVLKLAEQGGSLPAESGQVLWAPDSRRVAFNYRAGGRYYSCAVYELAGDTWKELPDLETKATKVAEMMARSEQRQRRRLGVTKSAHRRRINDTWEVLRWLDPDRFEALATSEATVVLKEESGELGDLGTRVLFTVKCDNRGGWKVVRLRELSDAELEKLNIDK